MITIPIYDTILLPEVTFFFRNDVIDDWNISNLSVSNLKAGDELCFVMLKEDMDPNKTEFKDIYPIGVFSKVESIDADGNVKVKAISRVNILDFKRNRKGEIKVEIEFRPEIEDMDAEEEKARFEQLRNSFLSFVQNYQWGLWARAFMLQWKNVYDIACSMMGYFMMDMAEKYEILAVDSKKERFDLIEYASMSFMELTDVAETAEQEQQQRNENLYREDAIKKQIDILQRELDEMHPENISDVRRFEKSIAEAGMNEDAEREAKKVLNRMKQEGQDSHEYGMLYDYLDFVTTLSWKNEEYHPIDLNKAEEVLDREHYGLKKVKERIIQQLAVMALNKKQSGSILLFVGAPGTGKTSIGQSIAEALDRKYVRISLGGVRDEAEIRGHRRTYIGAMPGRIMEGLKRSGASNPVMVLDEVDKLVRDYGGDPSSALLEVLDPEQNGTFTDHYMNVPYDLSNVLFVCTANTTDTIPEPLLNRMEIIEFPGYTATEKFYIAKKHLIPKAMKASGLKRKNMTITDAAIRKIISDYTMESGVRGLKKQIDTIMRTAAVKMVKGQSEKLSVKPNDLRDFIGHRGIPHDLIDKKSAPGVVTGLAWTMAGGEILFIETKLVRGSGKTIITGQLGDVMKESVSIAISLVKDIYPEESKCLDDQDLHIHVPEGAVPKDGPSAGITLITALSSLVTGKAVDPTVAMTGEISLRGNVMPIGGLPEKLMAAVRAGVKTVYIPEKNVEDLEDVAEEVKNELNIVPVKKIKDVLSKVLK
ncbi:MAG: endopeptidase La [Eubacterium sp.]|nr:endopeptidase La [Eubacterium sp.]